MGHTFTPITYASYAKINLYLDVLGKRRDGFHNIETIFQTVSLTDKLSFEELANRVSLTCSTSELDSGESNLVYRAAMLLRQRSGCELGARIHLEKNVPIAAGLAGGSGNAAATLLALNTLWDLRWSLERLRSLALELGSDVPYCTMGGTAAATRRGEELYPLPALRKLWLVLVHPRIAVSASHTYNHAKLSFNEENLFAGRTKSFRNAIRALASEDFAKLVYNRMETPVFHDHPRLVEVKRQLLDAGCLAAAMSGSGPTLFGLCPSKRTAERVAGTLGEHDTSVVSTVPAGLERIQ